MNIEEEETDPDAELTACHACGGPLTFDPTKVGDTVGGLTLRGWLMCACGKGWLTRRAVPAERWRVSSGGRSVETGDGRIRVDGGGNVSSMVARLVRLPDLEETIALALAALRCT